MKDEPSPEALVTGIGAVIAVLATIIVAGTILDVVFQLPKVILPLWDALWIFLAILGAIVEGRATFLLWTLGKGTPNPKEPPRRLVIDGVYRHSRNPLYLARLLILAAFVILLGSLGILLLTLALFLGLQFAVLPREEKRLELRFGRDYLEYRRRVSRWITIRGLTQER